MWGSQTVAGDCPVPRWCCTWACTRVVGVAWVHHLWCRSGSTGSAVGCGSFSMHRAALLVTRYTQLPCAVHLDSSHVRRCNYHNVLLVVVNIWARHSARNAATATLYTRVISCANHMCLVPGEYRQAGRIPGGKLLPHHTRVQAVNATARNEIKRILFCISRDFQLYYNYNYVKFFCNRL